MGFAAHWAGAAPWAGPAPGPAADAPRELGRVSKRVFVVGDSLAVGTRPYLGRALRGWRVGHSVSISKHAPEGAAELARRGARRLPPVMVAGSVGYNGVLRRLAHKRRDLLVFNWTRMVSRNRGWLADDGVHVTGVVYAARARGIAAKVRECRRRVVRAGEDGKKRKK